MFMRKTFPCGHSGQGQYCHRCAQQERETVVKKKQNEALAHAPIPLDHLPAHVARRAVEYLARLAEGASYEEFRGKRLTHINREIISIPLPSSYRLIIREKDSKFVPVEALSHEAYNRRVQTNIWPQ